MFCSNCGAKGADTAVFCTKCGSAVGQLPSAAMPAQLPAAVQAGATMTTMAGAFRTLRIILLVIVGLAIPTAGVIYFTAPGPSQTVRNFSNDCNNCEWKKVAGYASSDTCKYIEKQRDMAVSMLKLATSLTGLLHGALPSILENSMGVMGVSPDRLQKMNGRELFAGLLKVSDQLERTNGGKLQGFDVDVLSERINGNTALVRVRDRKTSEENDINLIREIAYWKIDFTGSDSPVFPLEYMLQNAGLAQPQGNNSPKLNKPAPQNNSNKVPDNKTIQNSHASHVDQSQMQRWAWTSERPVTDSDLKMLSAKDLEIMRNEIYARHGWIFTRPDLRSYFEHQTWYKPAGIASESDTVNNQISANLSAIEQENAARIRDYEKSL